MFNQLFFKKIAHPNFTTKMGFNLNPIMRKFKKFFLYLC